MKSHELVLLDRWRRQRDPEAFREIVSRHGAMVYATCHRILGNAADAEDVTQECFMQLVTRPTGPRSSVGGWLHALATHRALDKIRSEYRRRTREAKSYAAPTTPSINELVAHIDEAMTEIDPARRALLVSHYFEGHSHDAIAREQGVSRSTITRQLARGVDELRARLRARGVTVAAAVLSTTLSELRAEALPASTATALGKLALAGVGPMPLAGILSSRIAASIAGALVVALLGVGGARLWWYQNPASADRGIETGIRLTGEIASGRAVGRAINDVTQHASAEVTAQSVVPASVPSGQESPTGAFVEGVVKDLHGVPVAGAEVGCSGANHHFPGSTTRFTDDAGRFRYENVPPSDEFHVYASTSQPRRRSETLTLRKIAAGDRYSVTLALHEAQVSGRVVDSAGHRVPGASVMAQPVKMIYYGIPTTRADAAGAFTIAGLAAGEYVLKAATDARTPWPRDGIHVTLEATSLHDGITLVLGPEPGPSIAGRVTDRSGAGIEDVHLSAHMTDPPYDSQWARTDPDGFYVIEGLSDAVYMVQLSHPGYGNRYEPNVAAGTANVDLVLEPRGCIEGVVVDAVTGVPVRRFAVLERVPASDVSHNVVQEIFREVDDVHGRFTLSGVGPGETPLRVRARGYAEYFERIEVPAGGVADAVIALKQSRIVQGMVQNVQGEPVAGAMVFAGKLPANPNVPAVPPVLSDAVGGFVIDDLNPDESLISCYHPQYAPAFAAVPSDDTRVHIELERGLTLRGTVMLDGEPAAWIRVSTDYPGLVDSPRGLSVDESGTFELTGVPRVDGTLIVAVPGISEGVDLALVRPLPEGDDAAVLTYDLDVSTGAGVVEGTIYERAQPRAGLFMTLRLPAEDGWSRVYSTHSSTPGGRFRFDALQASSGVVTVYPPGAPGDRDPIEVPVDFRSGTATCDIEIEL